MTGFVAVAVALALALAFALRVGLKATRRARVLAATPIATFGVAPTGRPGRNASRLVPLTPVFRLVNLATTFSGLRIAGPVVVLACGLRPVWVRHRAER